MQSLPPEKAFFSADIDFDTLIARISTPEEAFELIKQYPTHADYILNKPQVIDLVGVRNLTNPIDASISQRIFYRMSKSDRKSHCALLDLTTGEYDIFTQSTDVPAHLGDGNFGYVRLFDNKRPGEHKQKIAIKTPVTIDRSSDFLSKNELNFSFHECSLSSLAYSIKQASIPHTTCSLFATKRSDLYRMRMVLPYIPGVRVNECFASLSTLSNFESTRKWRLYIEVLRTIIKELLKLHKLKLIHGDINSNNILIEAGMDDQFTATFIDYGYSELKDQLISRVSIDTEWYGRHYFAPERIISNGALQYCKFPIENLVLTSLDNNLHYIIRCINKYYYINPRIQKITHLEFAQNLDLLFSKVTTENIPYIIDNIEDKKQFYEITGKKLQLSEQIPANEAQDVYSLAFIFKDAIKKYLQYTRWPVNLGKQLKAHAYVEEALNPDREKRITLNELYKLVLSESIQLAICEHNVAAFRRLLNEHKDYHGDKHRHELNAPLNNQLTYLHLACMENRIDMILYLLDEGANLESSITFSFSINLSKTSFLYQVTILNVALMNDNLELFKHLLIKGCNLYPAVTNLFHYIHHAATEENIKYIQHILGIHPDWLNLPDNYQQTPLIWASISGCTETVSYLVTNGADLNASTLCLNEEDDFFKSKNGFNALDWANFFNYDQISAYLKFIGLKSSFTTSTQHAAIDNSEADETISRQFNR